MRPVFSASTSCGVPLNHASVWEVFSAATGSATFFVGASKLLAGVVAVAVGAEAGCPPRIAHGEAAS